MFLGPEGASFVLISATCAYYIEEFCIRVCIELTNAVSSVYWDLGLYVYGGKQRKKWIEP